MFQGTKEVMGGQGSLWGPLGGSLGAFSGVPGGVGGVGQLLRSPRGAAWGLQGIFVGLGQLGGGSNADASFGYQTPSLFILF